MGRVPVRFDFTHLDLSLEYFEAPSDELIQQISRTDAAAHLKRHSDRTGYFPEGATSSDITRELLARKPSDEELAALREVARAVRADEVRQAGCMSTAASYLPEGAKPENPVHVTWGYDIGVAMDAHASLNLSHPHFLADPEEVWFYCIHEVHHSGLKQIHPMPRVGEIDSVAELYGFVRYATFIEGLAVHAARQSRQQHDALAADPDYVALADEARLASFFDRYRQKLDWLRSGINQPLSDDHWQIVEEMSSGDRLWYVVGAAMAAAIESRDGRGGLLGIEAEGPDAFFRAYEAVANE